MKYRSKYALYALILNACKKRAEVRNIQADSMLEPKDLKKKLAILSKTGLLDFEEVQVARDEHPELRKGVHFFYTMTPKGKRFLELYAKCLDMVKGLEEFDTPR